MYERIWRDRQVRSATYIHSVCLHTNYKRLQAMPLYKYHTSYTTKNSPCKNAHLWYKDDRLYTTSFQTWCMLVLTRQVHFHARGMPAAKRESPNLTSIHEWYIVYCSFLSQPLFVGDCEVESDSAMLSEARSRGY